MMEADWFNGLSLELRVPMTPSTVRDCGALRRGTFHGAFVASNGRQTIQLRPYEQGLLAARITSRLAAPRGQRVLLQRPAIAERQRPRQRARRIHEAQMQRGIGRTLAAREEGNAGNRRRHLSFERAQRRLRHLLGARLNRTLFAGHHHVGLEHHALEKHACREQMAEYPVEHEVGYLFAALQAMGAIHQYFGFDDGYYTGFLAQRGIARQRFGIGVDGIGARNSGSDVDHRAPLGEAARAGRRVPR
jgi:hypothetical protein